MRRLTPELKKRVEAKVKDCLKIAEKIYGRKFKMPEIRYDLLDTNSGLAIHGLWILRFNLIFLVENQDKFIEETIPHEVAHLVDREVNEIIEGKRYVIHGRGWKKVMELFKAPASITHSYDCSSIQRFSRRNNALLAA